MKTEYRNKNGILNIQSYQIGLAFNSAVYDNFINRNAQHFMNQSILKQPTYKCSFLIFHFQKSLKKKKKKNIEPLIIKSTNLNRSQKLTQLKKSSKQEKENTHN